MPATATVPLSANAVSPATRQAEREESVLARVSALEARWEEKTPELATRSDMHAMEARFEKRYGELHAAIEKSHSSTIRWVIGTGIALFLGLMNADKITGGNRQVITAPAQYQNTAP